MKLCSEICDTYARRVGNEVGWSGEVTTAGIKTLTARAAPRYKMSMKLLNEQAGDAICRMRVVYLVNLFECFMQDFIRVKDCLSHGCFILQTAMTSPVIVVIHELTDRL